MKTVVIMQPQFFPWRGLFEQMKLADEFVHLDDVQFQKGGFTNRVQIKTSAGAQWLTVPVRRNGSLTIIRETEIDYGRDWREKHRTTLRHAYARAPFLRDMLEIVDDVYAGAPSTIGDLDIAGIERVASYVGVNPRFSRSSATPVASTKTDRLIELLAPRAATRYVTGRGALDYLDEPLLRANGISVDVMAYTRSPYAQLHGTFDPHVSILDTVANLGAAAAGALNSAAVPWGQRRGGDSLP